MIPLFKVFMSDKVPETIGKVLMSGYIGQGPKVDEFEGVLREYFNHDYILTLNNGTAGLHLALHMLRNPSPGSWCDRRVVLSTPQTCLATNTPIIQEGFKIRWVDVNPNTMNIDLTDLARKIDENVAGITFVHWGGSPVDLNGVNEVLDNAEKMYGYRPFIIEDCAHALGATYDNKLIGTHGNYCMFSLQAIKHITAIDGGLLLTPNIESYCRGKLLRWYGIDRETNRKNFRCELDVAEAGFKYHMNDVCATVGMENFKSLDAILRAQRGNANYYDENLKDIPGVELIEVLPDAESAYWLYTIKVEDRAGFMESMKAHDIMVSQVHQRNDIHSCMDRYRSLLPGLDALCRKNVCIPVGWWIDEENRKYIVETIKRGW